MQSEPIRLAGLFKRTTTDLHKAVVNGVALSSFNYELHASRDNSRCIAQLAWCSSWQQLNASI